MKTLFFASALALGSVCSQAANVAFVKGNEVSVQENGALSYFQKANLGDVVNAADLNDLSGYDALWIHIDRKGLAQGWNNLPGEFTSKVQLLKDYVDNGGNLYLTGHATQLVAAIDRAPAPGIFGSGNGGNGDDSWNVSACVFEDINHPIYNGLDQVVEAEYLQYGLIYGGGSVSILREDHNCMWDLGENCKGFETANNAMVLGSWGQHQHGQSAGIIEFRAQADGKGTVLVNGLAANQWVMTDGNTNVWQSNIEKLAFNALSYLTGSTRWTPGGSVENPDDPETPSFETPDSTGSVAMLVNYGSAAELAANFMEQGALNLFKKLFPAGAVLYNNELDDLASYDCIWVNIERDNIGAGWQNLSVSTEFVNALADYVAEGGNLYLSKHAAQLVNAIGRSNDAPLEFGNTDPNAVQNRNDKWQTNVFSNGTDWSVHTIYSGLTCENVEYGKVLTLLEPGVQHYDRNCMWKLNELGGHDAFCTRNHARVLGTWGHNGGQAWAGIVEFLPGSKGARAIAEDDVNARKGTIVANGLAAYHVAPLNGSTNQAQGNINTLTSNILSYLSPKTEKTSTAVEALGAEAGEAIYFNLQGQRVANPESGLYIKVQNGRSSKVLVK